MDMIKKIPRKRLVFLFILSTVLISSIYFVYHNHAFYQDPIVQVTKVTIIDEQKVSDGQGNTDIIYTQAIEGKLKNSPQKDERVYLENEFSQSRVYHPEFQEGDDVFVTIDQVQEGDDLTGSIIDAKRDHYLLLVCWFFILVLIAVGRRQGLFAVISLVVNAVLLSLALDVYIATADITLLFIMSLVVIVMTALSLVLVSGLTHQTYAAIIATLIGTFSLLFITILVLAMTNAEGLRFEEMEFLTRPPEAVFMAGVLVGALGAVMDVAVTISSSLFSLYEKNHQISDHDLKQSGIEIGKDIMGTMTNILFFAYVSGTIPTLLIYFMNGAPLGFTLSLNLSLELTRALAGGIGIVLAIPIGLYTTIFFINRKRASV
ncbi:YibE/F family protein [Amphibacillus cookii]|uniref:YibE/F family protein n=1 Tax=Amphibacillus cookii TaxID=767787 RepID=UPI00195C116E|nr:YibE/F family protein [Amphibacillus cookii]MBM7541045.1 putative membrane protein [Amphibacillus cookii]